MPKVTRTKHQKFVFICENFQMKVLVVMDKFYIRSNRRNFKFENFKLYVVSNYFPHEDYLDDSE